MHRLICQALHRSGLGLELRLVIAAAGIGFSTSCSAPPVTEEPPPVSTSSAPAAAISPALPQAGATGFPDKFTLQSDALAELSGMAASRAHPGVLWTHNDSGSAPEIMAFDASGRPLGIWSVPGASAVDWEDMALARGSDGRWRLWIADCGQGDTPRQPILYSIPEPDPRSPGNAKTTDPATRYPLRWPQGTPDCEALMVHPHTGDVYLLSKEGGRSAVCVARRADLQPGGETLLSEVAIIKMPGLISGLVTGADISPDGRSAVVCSYTSVALFRAESGSAFDSAWTQPALSLNIPFQNQRECVCFTADGRSVLTSREGSSPEVRRTPVP